MDKFSTFSFYYYSRKRMLDNTYLLGKKFHILKNKHLEYQRASNRVNNLLAILFTHDVKEI